MNNLWIRLMGATNEYVIYSCVATQRAIVSKQPKIKRVEAF